MRPKLKSSHSTLTASRWDWTTVDATQRQIILLGFGDPPPGPTFVNGAASILATAGATGNLSSDLSGAADVDAEATTGASGVVDGATVDGAADTDAVATTSADGQVTGAGIVDGAASVDAEATASASSGKDIAGSASADAGATASAGPAGSLIYPKLSVVGLRGRKR